MNVNILFQIKNFVEFLDKFIGLEISKIKNQNFHKYSNILQ